MIDDILKFDFDEANVTIDLMGNAYNQLDVQLNNIDGVVRGKLATWSGAARDFYNENHTKWRASADQMGLDLVQAQQALNKIREEWLRAENANSKRFA